MNTEEELKQHLRDAATIISNVGTAIGLQGNTQLATHLVSAMEHIEMAAIKFGELRN